MSGALRAAASETRKAAERAARRVSPPLERFHVLRISPLLLEASGSDLQLSEEDSDVEIHRGLRRLLQKGDDVLVGTEADGGRVVMSIMSDHPDPEPANSLTAPNEDAVGAVYGETEAEVIRNLRRRVNELEDRLRTTLRFLQ